MDVVLENDDSIIEEEMFRELNRYLASKKFNKVEDDDKDLDFDSLFKD